MATRSSIFITFTSAVTKKPVFLRYYKHSDGYPTDNLKLIGKLLEELKSTKNVKLAFSNAATENESKVEYEGSKNNLRNIINHNEHGDLEWTYLVDLDAKEVKVARGYNGTSLNLFMKRYTNPLDYVQQLHDWAQEKTTNKINEAVTTIKTLGYKVN